MNPTEPEIKTDSGAGMASEMKKQKAAAVCKKIAVIAGIVFAVSLLALWILLGIQWNLDKQERILLIGGQIANFNFLFVPLLLSAPVCALCATLFFWFKDVSKGMGFGKVCLLLVKTAAVIFVGVQVSKVCLYSLMVGTFLPVNDPAEKLVSGEHEIYTIETKFISRKVDIYERDSRFTAKKLGSVTYQYDYTLSCTEDGVEVTYQISRLLAEPKQHTELLEYLKDD